MDKKYQIDMVGFYQRSAIESMTTSPGVYFVFAGRDMGETCEIRKLLYIGKAEDQGVSHRLQNHEKMPLFESEVKPPEELFFAYATVELNDVAEVENALIKHFDPVLNKQSTESFTSKYDVIEIQIMGSTPAIFSDDSSFSVEPSK